MHVCAMHTRQQKKHKSKITVQQYQYNAFHIPTPRDICGTTIVCTVNHGNGRRRFLIIKGLFFVVCVRCTRIINLTKEGTT
jgi:hypothetical protein